MTLGVWSERDDPRAGGKWRDCTYSAGLTGLVFGGFTKFPKGIYTVAEREALESSDSRPDEEGANLGNLIEAVHNRYGIDWHTSAVSALDTYSKRTDLGFIIGGKNGNLAAGHTLRRWDPGFTGGHRVFVVPLGDGTYFTWYDPEAPMKYAGDKVSLHTIKTWIGTFEPNVIIVRKGVYAPAPPVTPPVTPPPVKTYTQAELDAAVKAATDPLNTKLAALDAEAKAAVTAYNTLLDKIRPIAAAMAALNLK